LFDIFSRVILSEKWSQQQLLEQVFALKFLGKREFTEITTYDWVFLPAVSELESLVGKSGVAGSRGINEQLVKIFEALREKLQAGFPAYGIPSLDPLFIPRAAIDIRSESAKYVQKYYIDEQMVNLF
jgi:hypothetical protein